MKIFYLRCPAVSADISDFVFVFLRFEKRFDFRLVDFVHVIIDKRENARRELLDGFFRAVPAARQKQMSENVVAAGEVAALSVAGREREFRASPVRQNRLFFADRHHAARRSFDRRRETTFFENELAQFYFANI